MAPLFFRTLQLSEAPYAVLEHAHWVPHSAGLSERFRPKPSGSSPDEKRFLQLRRHWRTQEIWLTHALECVLLGLGPSLVCEVFADDSGGAAYWGLLSADWPGINRHVGVPDLIVANGSTLFLVEVKSGSTRSNHRYSLRQYAKYMKFAALALCSGALVDETGTPMRFSNAQPLLVAPAGRIEDVVNDCAQWRPAVDANGRVAVGMADVRTSIEHEVSAFLRSYAGQYCLAKDGYRDLAQIPTRLVPWPDFCGSLARVAAKGGRRDLAREADRLLQLSTGRAPLRLKA